MYAELPELKQWFGNLNKILPPNFDLDFESHRVILVVIVKQDHLN